MRLPFLRRVRFPPFSIRYPRGKSSRRLTVLLLSTELAVRRYRWQQSAASSLNPAFLAMASGWPGGFGKVLSERKAEERSLTCCR